MPGKVAIVDPRRFVPRTDSVLADPRLAAAAQRLGKARVKAAVTRAQQQARTGEIRPADVTEAAVAALPARATTLTPVVNATGVLLHTNLGRAPLSAAARDALLVAAGCTDLEFDLASGERGRRGRGALAALAAAVPAAQAVHVVNNNAAALVLAATALAAGCEIVVSRGELIEIGDRFRLPELLESTGAQIREVGTTNRTTLADYAAVIGPHTGFVLKVHPSNYRVEGFTSSASVAELAGLPVPVVGDLGSARLSPAPLPPSCPHAGFLLPHVVSLRMLPGGEPWVFFAIACAMGADTGRYLARRHARRPQLLPRAAGSVWSAAAVLAPRGRRSYGRDCCPQKGSALAVLPSRSKHEAPLMSVERVLTPAACNSAKTPSRG